MGNNKTELTEHARRLRNEYHREYRRRNRGKIRLINNRYWNKKVFGSQDNKTEK
jgi:hypothetical protein